LSERKKHKVSDAINNELPVEVVDESALTDVMKSAPDTAA